MIPPAWLCAGALILAGCTAPAPPPPGEAVVYVIERGWHSDIGLPVEELTGPLAAIARAWSGANFLTFGFGDRGYVVDQRQGLLDMLSDLLPSKGVLLVTALSASPSDAFGTDNVVRLHLSQAGLVALEARIGRSLANGTPTQIAEGPYPGSAYYASDETYDGLYTCNTWSADVLRAGGLPISNAGVLFVGQVMAPARRLAR